MKRKLGIAVIFAALLAAVLAFFYGGSQVPAGQSPLRSLTAASPDDVKNEFNLAKNSVRVLLLVSPT
ncbi:MAG TPA: hypothetical protein VFA54_12140 [Bryobacterales bacterium]|jgi:hypothetical protein|nr:hypothetical protein [Bryobacterales bacterium]